MMSRSRICWLGLKCTTCLGLTSTAAPVLGFLPVRADRGRVLNVPKPRISTRPLAASRAAMASKIELTRRYAPSGPRSGFLLAMRCTSSDRVIFGFPFRPRYRVTANRGTIYGHGLMQHWPWHGHRCPREATGRAVEIQGFTRTPSCSSPASRGRRSPADRHWGPKPWPRVADGWHSCAFSAMMADAQVAITPFRHAV